MKALYVNPFTDFGFKKLFGEEASKPLLIDFLNSLLPEKDKIVSIVFGNTGKLGKKVTSRNAVYDIFCTTDKDEKFIVEMQKTHQEYFKDRTLFYSTFPIQEQAQKGAWNYELKTVYCVGILDFKFKENEGEVNEVVNTVQLKNQKNDVFYDKLTFVYLEMPNFTKKLEALETRLDKWLYFIKHLEDFTTIPQIFNDSIFKIAFDKTALARYNSLEINKYEQSLKNYRDNHAVVNTAFKDGKEEGKIEGKKEAQIEMIRNMFSMNLSIENIAKITKLSEAEIKMILDN